MAMTRRRSNSVVGALVALAVVLLVTQTQAGVDAFLAVTTWAGEVFAAFITSVALPDPV